MEQRLIDANKASAVILNIKQHLDSEPPKTVDIRAVLMTAIEIIGEQPTVDAAPVVHAKWIEVQLPLPLSDGSKIAQRCSSCRTHWDTKTHYCPYCGAKMGEQRL